MILVRMNHRELTTESNNNKLSIMRFCYRSEKLCTPGVTWWTYLTAFLEQHLVVLAQGNTEDDGRDVLEAVNPFLAFTTLPAHIKHARSLCQPRA